MRLRQADNQPHTATVRRHRSLLRSLTLCLVGGLLVSIAAQSALAQINTDIIEKYRAELQKQATDPEMKRERGTQSQDWIFALPEGVTSRQLTFYSDGTPCYGRLFFPKGFHPRGKWPAVVVGHGINAQAVGIEKYAARFAERGLVALAIDYRTYGYSGGDVLLLEPDTTTDARTVWEKQARLQIKRTNLNNFREAEDFRAAISYLQTEPGVDPERIGIWGSSNGASVVLMVAALDARVKAVVAQVGAASGLNANGPVAISPQLLEDGIKRARTGQGAEVDGGFSFRSKIDLWSNQVNREFRPAARLDHIPHSTKILWLPVEKDELIPIRSVELASKAFKGISQVTVVPYLTHFQMYSYAGFEVSSQLAADWFLKYLDGSAQAEPVAPVAIPALATVRGTEPRLTTLLAGVAAKDIHFYSEGIRCSGRLFTPSGFNAESKAPAVVLAPGWGQTAAAVEADAAQFAARGLVALAMDYRGWGRSGGYLQTVDEVKTDDRLRFSQLTARVRIRRKRLLPQQQILDIRNALYFLQGEPGIDRTRIGVWGVDMSGGHAAVVAATDARVKAVVLQTPVLTGQETPRRALALSGELLRAEQQRARTGQVPPSRTPMDFETRLALAEYQPFWYVEQIPQKTAVLFILADKASPDGASALAAAKLLKGLSEIVRPTRAQAAQVAAEWFLKHL
jgi:uncharacterized protein